MSTVIKLFNSLIIVVALVSSASLLASRCTPAQKLSGSAGLEGFVLPAEASTWLSAVRIELMQARCSSRSQYSGQLTGNKYLELTFPSLMDCLHARH